MSTQQEQRHPDEEQPTGQHLAVTESYRDASAAFARLKDVVPESHDDAFLIDDLLTSRMTFLTGEPKAGKSLFVAGMLRALLEGHDEFIGQRVHRRLESVVYGFTDDGAESELQGRLAGTEAVEGVLLQPMYAASLETWEGLVTRLLDVDAGLFVLDTVMGALGQGEDIAAGPTAQRIIDCVRPISQAGIPVLLVTHTPKGVGEGLTTASSVMGGRGMAGGVRGVIALRKAGGNRRITTSINRARHDLDIGVQVGPEAPGSDVPVWSVRASRGPARTEKPSWKDRLVERVVKDQPAVLTAVAVAKLYATDMGVSANTIRAELPRLLELDDGVWQPAAA